MKLLFRFVISLVLLLAPTSAVSEQASRSMKDTSASASKTPKWSEADKKELLTKARAGDSDAQFWLGAAYEQGWFGKADFQEALKWFKAAAKRGDADAQSSLGQMYGDGEGAPRNYFAAARWYRRAAEHIPDFGGAGQGRNNLGLLYMKGLGVSKEYVRAYKWFSLAHSEANLSYAKAQMSPAQISEAERLVAEWKARHPEPGQW